MRWVVVHYGLRFLVRLVGRAWRPVVLRKVVETAWYMIRNQGSHSTDTMETTNECGELLSIAVASSHRKRGVGHRLLAVLEARLVQQRCKRMKVATASADLATNSFYRRTGFGLVRPFVHHGVEMHEYCKTLTHGEKA